MMDNGNNNRLQTFTRINGQELAAIANPNVALLGHFMRPEIAKAVYRARLARVERLGRDANRMPYSQAQVSAFELATIGLAGNERLRSVLPADGRFEDQAHQAITQFAGGVTAAATIRGPNGANAVANWDTHKDHVEPTNLLLRRLFEVVDSARSWAEQLGIADKLVVTITSDVGRTPFNSTRGKDHLGYTSMVVMKRNFEHGNRVVGNSGPDHVAPKINPSTLQVDPAGIQLTPAHFHRALRTILNIEDHPIARRFPFDEPELTAALNPAISSIVSP